MKRGADRAMTRWWVAPLLVGVVLSAHGTSIDAVDGSSAIASRLSSGDAGLDPRPSDTAQRRSAATVSAPVNDGTGVQRYAITSQYLGTTPSTVRVVEPTAPVAGIPRRLLFILPVEPGVTNVASEFGDGLDELRQMDVANRYNLTLIEPSFSITPWYVDHPTDRSRRLESFIVQDLVAFSDRFIPPGVPPQRWLIGFSKSGFGALSLILRHPDLFDAAAVWDAPVQFDNLSAGMGLPENAGTEANFDRYEIPRLLSAADPSFKTRCRLWIGVDQSAWTEHMKKLDAQMTSLGIVHGVSQGRTRLHAWYGGWLGEAVKFLVERAAPSTRVATASNAS